MVKQKGILEQAAQIVGAGTLPNGRVRNKVHSPESTNLTKLAELGRLDKLAKFRRVAKILPRY